MKCRFLVLLLGAVRRKLQSSTLTASEQADLSTAFALLPMATMLRLNREQRALLAEKIPDIANIGTGALVFGQTLDGGHFSRSLALVGFVVWVLLFGFAMMFAGGAQE